MATTRRPRRDARYYAQCGVLCVWCGIACLAGVGAYVAALSA